MTIQEIITILLGLIGVGFMTISAVGLARLPDVYTRMHAGGKSSTLGVIAVLLAVAIYTGDLVSVTKMLALIVFFLLTAPVAAHMLCRAAYLTNVKPVATTSPDQLADKYDPQTSELR